MAGITASTKATVSIPALGGKALPLTVHTKTVERSRDADGNTVETPLAEPKRSLVWAPDGDTSTAWRGVVVPVGIDAIGTTATVKIGRKALPITLAEGVYGKGKPSAKPMLRGTADHEGVRATVQAVRQDDETVRLLVSVTKAPSGGGGKVTKVAANPFA